MCVGIKVQGQSPNPDSQVMSVCVRQDCQSGDVENKPTKLTVYAVMRISSYTGLWVETINDFTES